MTEEIARTVARMAPQDDPVFTVEEDGVWLSGLNANLKHLHHVAVRGIQGAGYDVGETRDEAGGYFVEVPGAVDVDEEDLVEVLEEVVVDG